jgi:hypothetical protein
MLTMKTMTAVLNVLTYIITSITACFIGDAVILVIISVSAFITTLILCFDVMFIRSLWISFTSIQMLYYVLQISQFLIHIYGWCSWFYMCYSYWLVCCLCPPPSQSGAGDMEMLDVRLFVCPSVWPSEICCKHSKIFICWPIDFKLTHKHYIRNL